MEDLWCFNEEIVARAISASGVPVISAVGHEIDFTISDFVADLRAPTPSAAAEMVVNRKEDLEHKIDTIGDRLRTALRQRLLESKARLASVRGSRVFVEPKYIAGRLGQDIAALGMRMKHATGNRTRDYHQGIDDSVMRIERHVREYLRSSRDRVGRFENQLRALNPKAVLVRGYSITMDGDGRVLRSMKNLDKGDRVTTHLSDGEFTSDVVSTKVGS